MSDYQNTEKQENKNSYVSAELAAELAVKKTFAILGVDIDQPAQVESLRESLRFVDKLRQAADRGIMTFVSAVVVLTLAALIAGVKFKLEGHG